jgi:hypothetical protein
MKIENFYFEPIPPKHPPVVTYQSDDTRKINNLRQTLFQVAYRYVYMDWRKSTFSPASIVSIPQAEEETATGLANEQISLNNKLQIVINTGGEEVRAIEIVGRSSQDPSKWFLIETINKFEEQERGNEISIISEPSFVILNTTPMEPATSGDNAPDSLQNQVGMSVLSPLVMNTFTFAEAIGLSWDAEQGGVEKTVKIDCNPNLTYITSFPDWIFLKHATGYGLYVGMSILNGDVITVYPTSNNTGPGRSGYIIITNSYGDLCHIIVTQSPVIVPPIVTVFATISIDPEDISGMTLGLRSGGGQNASKDVSILFFVNHPLYNSGQYFDIFWRALVNGNSYGNGILVSCIDETVNTRDIVLNSLLVDGDVLIIYLSTEAILETQPTLPTVHFILQQPDIINSDVLVSVGGMGWDAVDYGIAEALKSTVTCPPVNCSVISKPSWITIRGEGGYDLGVGATINTGEEISVFPTEANTGGVISGIIVLTNSYGNSASIFVSHSAVVVPPSGIPIPVTILRYTGDGTAMMIPGSSASAVSADNRINWSCLITGLVGATLYWRAYKDGSAVIQGSGSFAAHNGSNFGTLVLDNTLVAGDIITVYFSSVTF